MSFKLWNAMIVAVLSSIIFATTGQNAVFLTDFLVRACIINFEIRKKKVVIYFGLPLMRQIQLKITNRKFSRSIIRWDLKLS